VFEDFITQMPLGQRFFAGYNPVRTGGPMQVGVEFAERQLKRRGYPYRMTGSLRDEVFSRRGGLYFGIAHLLDYPAHYEQPIYRFADFNAGQYASRNAAFQNAVAIAAGIAESRLELEQTRVYQRVFELAEQTAHRPLPRAMLPRIRLQSPKIIRPLTTGWFAKRVDERFRRCLPRAGQGL
jgi:hypothetical protein